MRKAERLSAVIAGVGHTEYSTNSGRLERALAIEAILNALKDAGLTLSDVDGLATYEVDTNDPLLLAHELALPDLSWFSRTPYGGGQACATIQDAALAIDAGIANVVVVYRGLERGTYSCTPDCERRITLGDANPYFEAILAESAARNGMAMTNSPVR